MKRAQLAEIANLIQEDQGIEISIIKESFEEAILLACKKKYGEEVNFDIQIELEQGKVIVYRVWLVVENAATDINEINYQDALEIKKTARIGEELKEELKINNEDFGRNVLLSVKQVLRQNLKNAKAQIIYEAFADKSGTIVEGIVVDRDDYNVFLSLDGTENIGFLSKQCQIFGEQYNVDDKYLVFVSAVQEKNTKRPQIEVSRIHNKIMRELFERNIPEIAENTIEIASIARENTGRSKVAIFTNDLDVDAIGACIGENKRRIRSILNELADEKVDLIEWLDPKEEESLIYNIASSLQPSLVLYVEITKREINEDGIERKEAMVIVPDDQLTLAIGKAGQNVRLASKLVNCKIDIISESQAQERNIEYEPNI